MTRKKHDQYSKQFVAELLEPQGEVQVNYEIPPGKLIMPIFILSLLQRLVSKRLDY